MLNGIFVVIVLFSILMAAFTGRMEMLSKAVLESARSAVTLALGLIGVMAFFLGLMRVASDGGLLRIMARAVHPVMRFLFPAIPRDHPAMSAMILNITSNLLGLGNAATPFGLKAMMELDRLNNDKGTATNAMVLFLALNTSGLALLPWASSACERRLAPRMLQESWRLPGLPVDAPPSPRLWRQLCCPERHAIAWQKQHPARLTRTGRLKPPPPIRPRQRMRP